MIAGSSLRNVWTRRDTEDQTFEPDIRQIAGFFADVNLCDQNTRRFIQPHEADAIAERMRERLAQRGSWD